MTQVAPRAAARITRGTSTRDDHGRPAHVLCPSAELPALDPFLQVMVTGPLPPTEESLPAPAPYLHAGHHGITLVLAGTVIRTESTGRTVTLTAGDVGSSVEGSGSVHAHATVPGPVHSVGLWLDVPQGARAVPPAFQRVHASAVPVRRDPGGGTVRVCVGSDGVTAAPVQPTATVCVQHWTLPAGGDCMAMAPAGGVAAVLVLGGTVTVGSPGTAVETGRFAVLADGHGVHLRALGDIPAEALVLSGVPLHQTVLRYGAVVAGSRHGLLTAIQAYHRSLPHG